MSDVAITENPLRRARITESYYNLPYAKQIQVNAEILKQWLPTQDAFNNISIGAKNKLFTQLVNSEPGLSPEAMENPYVQELYKSRISQHKKTEDLLSYKYTRTCGRFLLLYTCLFVR